MKYGLINPDHAREIASVVVEVMGGEPQVVDLLMETAAAETLLGQYPDAHYYTHGVGLTQVDEDTFAWLRDKYASGFVADCLKDRFGVAIAQVNYRELAFSPLLAFIWCRLRYMTVPHPVPTKIKERAAYWKRFYNTVKGKGTPQEYFFRATQCNVWVH